MKYLTYIFFTSAITSTQAYFYGFEDSCASDTMGCDFNADLQCLGPMISPNGAREYLCVHSKLCEGELPDTYTKAYYSEEAYHLVEHSECKLGGGHGRSCAGNDDCDSALNLTCLKVVNSSRYLGYECLNAQQDCNEIEKCIPYGKQDLTEDD